MDKSINNIPSDKKTSAKNTIRWFIKVILIILAVLIITNPGMGRFKDFGGEEIKLDKRLSNYFVFSVYEGWTYGSVQHTYYEKDEYYRVKYIGIPFNFFKISEN